MWNIEKEISYHEKCIRVLELIKEINNRILGNDTYLSKVLKMDFINMSEYYAKRKKIDLEIKTRLENYYLTLLHKKQL